MATNLWRRFGDLIKPPPQEVVTITLIYGDGTVQASTVAGGEIRLRCAIEVEVGDKALTAAGAVLGKVPDLPYYELEI